MATSKRFIGLTQSSPSIGQWLRKRSDSPAHAARPIAADAAWYRRCRSASAARLATNPPADSCIACARAPHLSVPVQYAEFHARGDPSGDNDMGLLVNGEWHTDWYDTGKTGGRFERPATVFRDRIEPGPDARFPAVPGRYHLYVSLACPWAHRTLILRKLKGLESMIGLSIVDPFMGDDGWFFSDGSGCIPDTVNGFRFLRELYTKAVPDFTGRVTVPVLWDKHRQTIVNNESAEIVRIFNSAFDGVGAKAGDYYPQALREVIDAVNALVYDKVNNGVYKAGFATRQAAYEEAARALFDTLDRL